MMNSKDPKYNMSDANLGRSNDFNNARNYSAVHSVKTAATSNNWQTMNRYGESIPHQYSTAVMGGGGPNIYDRLLNDSTENLLRPTAHMIGSANRIASNYITSSRPGSKMPPRTNTGPGNRTNARMFASANIRGRGPASTTNRPSVSDAY